MHTFVIAGRSGVCRLGGKPTLWQITWGLYHKSSVGGLPDNLNISLHHLWILCTTNV